MSLTAEKQRSIIATKKYVIYYDDRQKISQDIIALVKPFDVLVLIQNINNIDPAQRPEWMVAPCVYEIKTRNVYHGQHAVAELVRFSKTLTTEKSEDLKSIKDFGSNRVSGYDTVSDYDFKKAVNDDLSSLEKVCGMAFEVYEPDPNYQEIRVLAPDEKATQEKVNEYMRLRSIHARPSLQAWENQTQGASIFGGDNGFSTGSASGSNIPTTNAYNTYQQNEYSNYSPSQQLTQSTNNNTAMHPNHAPYTQSHSYSQTAGERIPPPQPQYVFHQQFAPQQQQQPQQYIHQQQQQQKDLQYFVPQQQQYNQQPQQQPQQQGGPQQQRVRSFYDER